MSEQTLTVPVPTAEAAQGGPGAGKPGVASPAPRRTPARPVVSLALLLFVPAVVLVLDGNLSVQTALVRFVAALLVSWAAARLVWATVRSATPAGAADAVAGRTPPARAEATSRPGAPSGASSSTAPQTPGMS